MPWGRHELGTPGLPCLLQRLAWCIGRVGRDVAGKPHILDKANTTDGVCRLPCRE